MLLAFLLLVIAPFASACEISCNLGQPDGVACRHEGSARLEAAGLCAHHVHVFGKRAVDRAPMPSAPGFQIVSNHLAGPACMNTPCHQGRASVEPSDRRSVSLLILLPAPLPGITAFAAQKQVRRPFFQNPNRKLSPHNLDPLVSALRI
jgi:hypothetical protein